MILSLKVVNFSRPFLVNFHPPVDNKNKLKETNKEKREK